jgi:hypothetical protein
MKNWLNDVLAELHKENLKPLGFTKVRHTFSRDCGTYWERFNFQGSTWNGTGVKWRFYINVGIEFKDLNPNPHWSYFSHTHWAARVDKLASSAPEEWDYDASTDREELKVQLAQLIVEASRTLRSRTERIRREYLAGS